MSTRYARKAVLAERTKPSCARLHPRRLLQSIVVILGVTLRHVRAHVSFGRSCPPCSPEIRRAGGRSRICGASWVSTGRGSSSIWRFCKGPFKVISERPSDTGSLFCPADLGACAGHGHAGAAAMFLAVGLALPLGVTAAVMRGKWATRPRSCSRWPVRGCPASGSGIGLIFIFGVKLRLVPISGMGTFAHLILPAVTLSAYSLARNSRLIRSSMLDVLNQDYIRTARAKGLHPGVVLRRPRSATRSCPSQRSSGVERGSCWAARSSPKWCSRGRAWAA